MKLQLLHRTRYLYPTAVQDSFNEVRLKPVTADGQVCHSFLLKILPPSRLSHYRDFYSNHVNYFQINDPHHELVIESHSTVSTQSQVLPADRDTISFDRMAACVEMESCYDFLQPSHYVGNEPEIWRAAVDVACGIDDVRQVALAIMRHIHETFTYTPLSTSVNTPALEVIRTRAGVCQDFAHVMLGMCRALTIPARYVSGYLYAGAGARLTGTEASHAWCEVFLPGRGWWGLDPTNNQAADEHYIKIGHGRDYEDVAPIKGHYVGSGVKELEVRVLVTEAPA